MNTKTYDVVVIGAGPGGYVAAIRAAQLGMTVACIDKEYWGGTCLNVGCIPSKALLDSSHLFYEANNDLAVHGVQVKDVQLDLPAMMKRKDGIVKKMTGGIRGLFRAHKIDAFQGLGKITAPGQVEVQGKDAQTLQTQNIIIATGSVPAQIPSLPFDGKHIVSSTEALEFDQVPKTFTVIGAGAVGLEMGSVWSRLGADVTVVEMMDTILPGMDSEMSKSMQKVLQKQGLKFKLQTSAKEMKIEQNQVHLTLANQSGEEETLTAEKVLVAVGRKPYTEGLGLEEAGVKVSDRGRVEINDRFETNVEGIYAIGDVVRGAMLAHKAEDEGIAAAEIIAGEPGHVNYHAIPNVVYTHPELASTGFSEEQAKEKGYEISVGKFPFMANGRAHAMNDTDGMVKVIAEANTGKLLGMHILSGHASDLIAEGAIALEFHGNVEDIAYSSHAHPTLPEAVREAAFAALKRPIHIAK